MPNTKSEKKHMKTSEARRQANRAVKTRVLSTRRRLYEAIAAGDAGKVAEIYRVYCSAVDKAVKQGALTKNAASRRKSRAAQRIKREIG